MNWFRGYLKKLWAFIKANATGTLISILLVPFAKGVVATVAAKLTARWMGWDV